MINKITPFSYLHKKVQSLPVALFSTALVFQIAAAQNATPTPDPSELQELVVTGETPNVYTAPASATSILKTNTPLLESPQAVSVVSEQLIKDQDAQDLEDVLKNVAGVSVGGYYDGWDYYRIRGFDSSFNTFMDGLRGDSSLSPELYGLERVEVIKGPASTLFGQAPLGGIVNIVSKRPQKDFFGEVGFTVASWDTYEGKFDINLPILSRRSSTVTPSTSKDGKETVVTSAGTESNIGIYLRVVGLYKNAESHVDYIETERLFIAPSLTFEFGENTTLTLLTEYKRDWGKFAMPLPAVGTVLYNPNGEISTSYYSGLPGSNDLTQERFKAGYEFKHKFNDVVSLRQNLGYSYLDQKWDNIFYNSTLASDDRTLYLYPYDYWSKYSRIAVDTALDFTFSTGPVDHSITVGSDYFHDESKYGSRQINYSDFPGSYLTIDLFNPNYNQSIPTYSTRSQGKVTTDLLGFYFQEHAKLGNVSLTVGGRYDKFWNKDSVDGTTAKGDQEAFTPKVGLTYEFVPGFAAYANYSRSFTPQWYSTDASGNSVDAEEGVNWEGGLKYSAFDGKWTGLVSVFQLTRENVATDNPATPDPYDYNVSGEQRSRGFEFETAAEPIPGLSITAAYTYIDAEVTEDNTIPVGTPLQGVPKHAFNAWVKYIIQDGPVKGLGAGIGGQYYTKQSGDTNHTFNIPAYGLVNAAIYYEREKFSAQVNFNNILDKRYFKGAYNDLYVLPGEPFNISASITWKF